MKIYKRIILFILSIAFLACMSKVVNAAGSFSVSSSVTSLNIGETATLTIKTSNAAGQFTISSSNSGIVSVSSSSKFVDGSEKITLTAKSAGSATITVTAKDVSDTELNDVIGSKTVTLNVKAPVEKVPNTTTDNNTDSNKTVTKSNDATLKSITIGNKKYSGSALKDTISYTVDNSVSSIKISAEKNNSKAKIISGTGTINLKEIGTNSSKIVVQAENGDKKTYTLNIVRLADDKVTPNVIEENSNTEKEDTELYLTMLTISGVDLNPEFKKDVFTYIANTKNMKSLEIDAVSNIQDAKIEIEGAEQLTEGDNKIKITVLKDDKKEEYFINVYNTIEEIEEILEPIDVSKDDTKNKNVVGNILEFFNNNKIKILFITLISMLSFIAIWCAFLAYKYNKKLIELTGLKSEEINSNAMKEEKITGKHF